MNIIVDSRTKAGSAKIECEEIPPLKFFVEFRRTDDYLNEYGFDWLREDDKYYSEDLEKLKNEYSLSTEEPKLNKFKLPITKIEGLDYFVPWLSFFPGNKQQVKQIRLKLKIHFLEGEAVDEDLVTLTTTSDNITFKGEGTNENKNVFHLKNHFIDPLSDRNKDSNKLKELKHEIYQDKESNYEELIEKISNCNDSLIDPINHFPFYTDQYESSSESKKITIKLEELNKEIDQETDIGKKNELFKSKETLEKSFFKKQKAKIIIGITKLIEGGREAANTFDIILETTGPLNEHTLITASDKNGNPVGYLKVLKNADYEDYIFEVNPIRVLRGGKAEEDKNTINSKVFGFDEQNQFQELEEYLNSESLNQALLKCKFNDVIDMTINETKWLEQQTIEEKNNIFKFNTNTTEILNKLGGEAFTIEFNSQKPQLIKEYPQLQNKRSVNIFFTPLSHTGTDTGAYGCMHNIDAQTCVIFESNLSDKGSISHEFAHVLGLEHTFLEGYSSAIERNQSIEADSQRIRGVQKDNDEINAIRHKIKECDKPYNYELKRKEYDKLIEDLEYAEARIGTPQHDVATKVISDVQKELNKFNPIFKHEEELKKAEENWIKKYGREYIKDIHRKNYYEGWNPHKFKQATTENMMDYYNKRVSFYKFQWLALQNDVKKFYSKKK